MSTLLVVAGEASGDRAAAAVVGRLEGVRAFGLGGAALASRGVELASDLREWTALGVGEATLRAGRLFRAWRALWKAIHKHRPRAALLADFTELNARLAPRLRAEGVRVLWYGAPQVWAWRPHRVEALRRWLDRLAVVLPFEEALWRRAGVDAHYVGHPALETTPLDRDAARRALGMTPFAATVAVLPGSRPHEVRRLLVPLLDGYEIVRADRASVDARVLVAGSLDAATRTWVRTTCQAHHVEAVDVDPQRGVLGVMRAFDAALCASGTASLEAALGRAVPIIAYRVGLATEITARALVRTPHIGLPNILLGRRAFPELLQREVSTAHVAAALCEVLDHRAERLADCDALEKLLGGERHPSTIVARMLAPWLGAGVRGAQADIEARPA